jgi:hypothetical protein
MEPLMTEQQYPESTNPDTVTDMLNGEFEHFRQRFLELMEELAGKEYPMTDNDLVLFRESLLDLPASQSGADYQNTSRQEALDDPEKLRQLYQFTLRSREAVSRIDRENGA